MRSVMHDTTDQTLLTAYHTGDHEAYAVLVARHEGVVRAACRRQAAAADIDDCVQAVFLVLARRPASATRAPALAAWLLRVASYVCRRAQRAAVRRRRAERSAAAQPRATETPDNEALDQLDDCLLRLPERQRIAVSLHYLAGKAPEEIAAALGVSRDNAYQLVSRGVAGLRTLLTRRGVAIAAPSLLALLAAEAHAAEASTTSAATVVTAITTPPSDRVTHLAHGALRTMAIPSLPILLPLVAAVCVSIGLASVYLPPAHELSPTSTVQLRPAAKSAQPPIAGAPDLTPVDAVLDQDINLDFSHTKIADVFEFLHAVTNKKVVVDPTIRQDELPLITMQVSKLPIRHVLGLWERMAHLTHTYHDETFFFHAAPDAAPVNDPDTADWSALPITEQRQLQKRIAYDHTDVAETDFYAAMRQASGSNIVLDPAILARKRTLSLTRHDTPVIDTLRAACEQTGARLNVIEQVIYIDVDPAPAATGPKPGKG